VTDAPVLNAALLGLRVAVGGVFLIHGVGKFARLPGLRAASAWFESIGLRPGRVHAVLAGLTEIAVGIGLVAGFLTALAAAALVALMTVAALTVTGRRGFLAERGGYEYNLVLAVLGLFVAASGPGRWSVDSAAGLPGTGVTAVLVAGVLGVASAFTLVTLAR
jgi:putative oxidoreductase